MWKGPPLDDIVEECRKKQNTSGKLNFHALNGLQTAIHSIQTDGYSALHTSSFNKISSSATFQRYFISRQYLSF